MSYIWIYITSSKSLKILLKDKRISVRCPKPGGWITLVLGINGPYHQAEMVLQKETALQVWRRGVQNMSKNSDRDAMKGKRKWKCGQVMNCEVLHLNDPNQFFNVIKQKWRTKTQPIPEEVYQEDGSIPCYIEDVLRRWMSDYGLLFSWREDSIEKGI